MVKSKRGISHCKDAKIRATDGLPIFMRMYEAMSKKKESGTYGPSAYLNQVFAKVVPKRFDVVKPKETDPIQKSDNVGQDANATVDQLLINNPTMSSATFLNLLKSQGIKFTKEADSSSANAGLVRGKESAISFRSVKFLERDNGPKSTDVGIAKPKDKYLGFTKFRAVMLQEGLGNFGDAYFYSADALNSAAPVFEGKKIYADHPSTMDEQMRPERSVRDVLGHFENVHVEQLDDGRSQLVGDVVILPTESFAWARSLMSHAVEFHEKFPDKDFVGLSINASGDANKVELKEYMTEEMPESIKLKLNEAIEKGITEIKIVSKINEAVSCDLVTEAGAGGGVKNYLESSEGNMQNENEEGGPGSGRRPGGGKGEQKPSGNKAKSQAKPAGKKLATKDYLSAFNDFEKSGAGNFDRNGKDATVWVRNGDWGKARALNDKLGGKSDIQPDPQSGKLRMKFYNVYENEKGENMEQENEMQQADGVEQPDHADENQDIELIKSMLKKAFGGEEDPSEEECSMAKEACEAYGEMGDDKEKAMEKAMEFMKASKHLAAKQAQKQSEAEGELKDEEKPVEESADADADDKDAEEEKPVKESAKMNDEVIKLRGELARYKEQDKKRAIAVRIEKICKESKRSNAYTSEFKTAVKDLKSIEEVEKAWKLFEAGRKASGENDDVLGDIFVQSEKTVTVAEGERSSLSFDDCSIY